MGSELTPTCRNIDGQPSIGNPVRRRIDDLERFHARLTGCDVVIEPTQARTHGAKRYRVCANLHLTGPYISVARCATAARRACRRDGPRGKEYRRVTK